MFDTYSDVSFVAITAKDDNIRWLWHISLAFLVFNLVCRLIVPSTGIFRRIVKGGGMNDLVTLVSAFDYISVIDVNINLTNTQVCNLIQVSFKAIFEDIPQAIIQLIYWDMDDRRKQIILVSAIVSITVTIISLTYGFFLLYFTQERRATLIRFIRQTKDVVARRVKFQNIFRNQNSSMISHNDLRRQNSYAGDGSRSSAELNSNR
jgi:hypothetical protein